MLNQFLFVSARSHCHAQLNINVWKTSDIVLIVYCIWCVRSTKLYLPTNSKLRVLFFNKIQDCILKSERIQKWILHFFTKQINPRSLRSWCIKGTKESTLEVDSLALQEPWDHGLICLEKKRKICFRILSDLRIQSWIFLKCLWSKK